MRGTRPFRKGHKPISIYVESLCNHYLHTYVLLVYIRRAAYRILYYTNSLKSIQQVINGIIVVFFFFDLIARNFIFTFVVVRAFTKSFGNLSFFFLYVRLDEDNKRKCRLRLEQWIRSRINGSSYVGETIEFGAVREFWRGGGERKKMLSSFITLKTTLNQRKWSSRVRVRVRGGSTREIAYVYAFNDIIEWKRFHSTPSGRPAGWRPAEWIYPLHGGRGRNINNVLTVRC